MTQAYNEIAEKCAAANSALPLYFLEFPTGPVNVRAYVYRNGEMTLVDKVENMQYPCYTAAVTQATVVNAKVAEYTCYLGYFEPVGKQTDNMAPIIERTWVALNAVLLRLFRANNTAATISGPERVGGADLYGQTAQFTLKLTLSPPECDA